MTCPVACEITIRKAQVRLRTRERFLRTTEVHAWGSVHDENFDHTGKNSLVPICTKFISTTTRIQRLRPLLSGNDAYMKVKRMVCLLDRSDFEIGRNFCAAQDGESQGIMGEITIRQPQAAAREPARALRSRP